MTTPTHDEIVRFFPGIQDQTVLEIQATNTTSADLEAALLLLQGDDEALLEYKRRKAGRLNQLLAILADWEALSANDVDR
ncbi:MAG: hypothetical protein OEW68_01465 [Gammaproteobacteria bacterium]|nr:hypothetical protein [Gammaproteobacteria bacterium]MDH4313493.1 hypothetical protein [Gammaproteobacteria bacterium]MDH5213873.1 hypothetical protein [Gammaproteobacteria bacterium]MDH5500884.1 hypothetical protein [Gammaproteobacteria bacterium]